VKCAAITKTNMSTSMSTRPYLIPMTVMNIAMRRENIPTSMCTGKVITTTNISVATKGKPRLLK
jgi:hypothetical protein